MIGTRTPATSLESRPAGLSEPPASALSSDLPLPGSSLSFTTSSLTTQSTESVGGVRPVEAITMSTLHSMLARVLEQTNALWQAQASTNHILDELRRSIPVPQENAENHERLRRVEALAGTLAHSQSVHLHLPTQSGQEIGSIVGAHQGRPPVNFPLPPGAIMSAQEATYHMDPILHATSNQYPTLGLTAHIRRREDGDEEVPPTIPPLGHVDQSTADPVISLGQMRLPEPQHGSELIIMSLPSTIEEDRTRPLSALDHHVSLTSHAYVPSRPANIVSEDTLHAREEQLDTEYEPSIPPRRDLDESSTVEPIQSTTQDTTPERAFDAPEVIQREKERMTREHESFATDREHQSAHKLDDKRQPSFAAVNVPQVAVTERIEALHNQLVNLTNLIRQILALCEGNGVLMEQQWSEKLRWKEECGRQIRELMGMASWLVEDRAAAKQREEDEKQAVKDNPRIEQVLCEIRKWDAKHKKMLQFFSDTWRADSERQNEEIINAVRATANEQVPYNVQGYLDEFIKALSTEVRMLLNEVGKLREERRCIQHEIGYLMMMQSTLVPGGEFGTDWPPEYSSPHAWPSPAGIPLPESPRPRSGWHATSLRGNRYATRPPGPPPPPVSVSQVHSWVTWQPNHASAPTPPSVEPTLLVLDRGSPGLFGPRSPRDSPRILPREVGWPDSPDSDAHSDSWVTWQPNPSLVPTPPSIEPTLLVPDRGSPGIFGPRSP